MSEYELSHDLFALRRDLADHHSGLVLTAEDVRELSAKLKTLGIIAQRDEHELRRLRACVGVNSALRRQSATEAAVLAAASQPGTNIRLLAFERPFSDGAPR